MRIPMRALLAAGMVVLGATASWAFGLNPFGPSGLPLTTEDFNIMATTDEPLLNDDTLPIGASRLWSNPKSGDQGTTTLLGRFEYDFEGNKLPCRKLGYDFKIPNLAVPYNFTIDRCRVADGTWKILSIGSAAGQNRQGH
jgi:hypothetical protein